MTAGGPVRFLEGYDEDAEAYASTFDVTEPSHSGMASGVRNDWPTITAAIGLGMMTEHEPRLAIDHVKGIDRRLGYNGGVS